MNGLYLLHLEPSYRHARHYLGFADDIGRRVLEHRDTPTKASPLLKAQIAVGGAFYVSRLFPGLTRKDERRLKRAGHVSALCPLCRPAELAKRRESWPARRERDSRYRSRRTAPEPASPSPATSTEHPPL